MSNSSWPSGGSVWSTMTASPASATQPATPNASIPSSGRNGRNRRPPKSMLVATSSMRSTA
jgi:hypothetical protein